MRVVPGEFLVGGALSVDEEATVEHYGFERGADPEVFVYFRGLIDRDHADSSELLDGFVTYEISEELLHSVCLNSEEARLVAFVDADDLVAELGCRETACPCVDDVDALEPVNADTDDGLASSLLAQADFAGCRVCEEVFIEFCGFYFHLSSANFS